LHSDIPNHSCACKNEQHVLFAENEIRNMAEQRAKQFSKQSNTELLALSEQLSLPKQTTSETILRKNEGQKQQETEAKRKPSITRSPVHWHSRVSHW